MWTGKLRLLFVCFFLTGVCPLAAWGGAIPDGFVVLNDIVPDVKVELRYYSNHNFVGERIDGYIAPKCLVTREAAEALKHVQEELRRFGLGLKIYDAYRPQRAVDRSCAAPEWRFEANSEWECSSATRTPHRW